MRLGLLIALGLVFAAGLGFAAHLIARDTVALPVSNIEADKERTSWFTLKNALAVKSVITSLPKPAT